ncbi:MAG: hypothetical protein IBX71_05280, partial [Candidatus Desulforudis sp.]|nr:hypothetical protein [Desulforudis sp.]
MESIKNLLLPFTPAVLLFCPAIVIAVVFSVYGIARRRPFWLVPGALLTMPFALYLLAT